MLRDVQVEIWKVKRVSAERAKHRAWHGAVAARLGLLRGAARGMISGGPAFPAASVLRAKLYAEVQLRACSPGPCRGLWCTARQRR